MKALVKYLDQEHMLADMLEKYSAAGRGDKLAELPPQDCKLEMPSQDSQECSPYLLEISHLFPDTIPTTA